MEFKPSIKVALAATVLLWVVFFANYFIPPDFRQFGIRPRNIDGLIGILTWPFLHGNIKHLTTNSFAFFCLLFLSLTFSKKYTILAVLLSTILGGAGVWLTGTSDSLHLGASGVIFGLLGFLLFIGIFRKEWRAAAMSVIVFLFYGGMLLTLLVNTPGVSWTGHFFGFAAGVFSAYLARTKTKTPAPRSVKPNNNITYH